jgi:hypothetical protein
VSGADTIRLCGDIPTEARHRVAPKMPHSKAGGWGATTVPQITDIPNDADP